MTLLGTRSSGDLVWRTRRLVRDDFWPLQGRLGHRVREDFGDLHGSLGRPQAELQFVEEAELANLILDAIEHVVQSGDALLELRDAHVADGELRGRTL